MLSFALAAEIHHVPVGTEHNHWLKAFVLRHAPFRSGQPLNGVGVWWLKIAILPIGAKRCCSRPTAIEFLSANGHPARKLKDQTLRVIVNGNEEQTEARTLDGLLRELGYGTAKVATALNGQFVPAAERSNVQLDSGAKIEIVSPRQGG